ncbi:hypothetical protein MNB_SV-14-1019 [hydrothermal vent metagenome]|uniref:Uncharacterized protein n=1 Tax=hydrothermal vent metagenome TaxID=652676 RepID=A0A1W1CCF1_9ZZZZ
MTFNASLDGAEDNIKSADVKSKVKVRKASGDDNSFKLTITSHRLSLAKFISSITTKRVSVNRKGKRYKGKRKIVKVKVRRGKAKELHGGFYASKQLFKREGKSRLPIKKLSTISVIDMFTEEIVDRGFKKVEENYPKTLERNFNFYIGK